MVSQNDLEKMRAFMQDLYEVCQKHRVHTYTPMTFRVNDVDGYINHGLWQDGSNGAIVEVGPVSDFELLRFIASSPSRMTENVFNSAGVDNPLPPQGE